MGKIISVADYRAGPTCLVMADKTMIGVSLYRPAVHGQSLNLLKLTGADFCKRNCCLFGDLLSSKYRLNKFNMAFDAANMPNVTGANIVV